MLEVGVVQELYYYPVKSMAGQELQQTPVLWHGFAGDRRYAFVRAGNPSNFPWLTARQLPAMLRYKPYFRDPHNPEASEVWVRTPEGADVALYSEDLRAELAQASEEATYLIHIEQGTFDEMSLSLISQATVTAIGDNAGVSIKPGRFRPNIVIETTDPAPYQEDSWPGGLLVFGDGPDAPRMRVNRRDPRCMMVNLDPVTTQQQPEVLKTIVKTRESCTGIYGAVEKPGTIRVGDVIRLHMS